MLNSTKIEVVMLVTSLWNTLSADIVTLEVIALESSNAVRNLGCYL